MATEEAPTQMAPPSATALSVEEAMADAAAAQAEAETQAPNPDGITLARIEQGLTVKQIKDALTLRGLNPKGRKKVLTERLKEAVSNEAPPASGVVYTSGTGSAPVPTIPNMDALMQAAFQENQERTNQQVSNIMGGVSSMNLGPAVPQGQTPDG